jgi:hypothetical protein
MANLQSDIEGACLPWPGAIMANGYGRNGRRLAHRVAYEAHYGAIPAGMWIDHLCRNRGCVNPLHLEAVTPAENTRRGALVALKTTCAQGHPWVPENIATKANGMRRCKECHREWSRLARERSAA